VGGLVDELMAEYDVREVHGVWIDAPGARVWSELHQVTLREMPVFRALMFLRRPHPRPPHRNRGSVSLTDRPLLAEMASGPFVPLAQRPPWELVLGLVARPWQLTAGLNHVDRPGFAGFDEPGWVKIVLGFELEERNGRTRISTETRVRATDAAARRRFRLYWLAIGPGSAATRRALLRAVKRRAESDDSTGGG
jgi:hypothetical protein